MNSRELTATDIMTLWSLLLAYQNLFENREQSAHNDVQSATDAQTQKLLEEVGKKFDEQNEMLRNVINYVYENL